MDSTRYPLKARLKAVFAAILKMKWAFALAFAAIIGLATLPATAATELPMGIEWLTNDTDPTYADPKAKPGGTLRLTIQSFPLTFRTVGPDSNSSFRPAILDNQLSLIGLHPNTLNIVPELATHWAFSGDKRTMYFKLNPKARWSDGHPVTADDFAFTLEFMRSEHIIAPWYNDYYTREIEKVTVYDDHTLSVTSTKAVPDLHLKIGITPTPRHFYGELSEDFVQKYNWEIVPNTGPYQIADFRKGKHIRFERKKDWWGDELRYFKNRFNVNRVIYEVVRNFNIEWEYFRKGRIDVFNMNFPHYWHEKSKIPEIENGYIHRIWFFNDTPQSAMGLWMNADKPIFKTPELRYAFAHAMNVQKVIDKVLRGDYFRLENGYVGYGEYSNTNIRAQRFDIDRVKYYMEEAGWERGPDGIWTKDGLRFSAEVTYSHEEHTPRLVVLKEEAQKAGVELRLQRLDSSAAYKKVMEKKHDVAWMGWSTSLRPRFWEHYHSVNAHKPQTNNITNTDNPELDAMIDKYRDSLDEQERIELSKKMQEKLHEICPFVPTFMVPYVRQAYWRWWRLPEPPGTKMSGDLFSPFDSATGGLFWFDKSLEEETKQAMKSNKKLEPVTINDETFKMEMIE